MKRAVIIFVVLTIIFVFIMKDKLYSKDKPGQIQIQQQTQIISEVKQNEKEPDAGLWSQMRYKPLNFSIQKAMWFTYMDYSEILSGKTEDEFTQAVKDRFQTVSLMGINTVYIQVRAFCDAYYKSSLFPQGSYYTDEGYDPLAIMVSQAHACGLSVHAWINPLRCVTDDRIAGISSDYLFRKWYEDVELCGKYIVKKDDRWYLNPAYDDVIGYVCSGVREILNGYNVDGIHIDDYFYPDTAPEFDSRAFAESGISDLGEFRRGRTDKLVREIYQTVKSQNPEILFGISPQGNIGINFNSQYADVRRWLSEEGYCDYIVPQLYYGYENETCPFGQTMDEWASLQRCDNVRLIIGVCTYKIGAEDKWAGSGKNEWIDKPDMTISQITDCVSRNNVDGVAIYSYSSTFVTGESAAVMADGGVQSIREILSDYNK
ncbi:MAG: family 10 glycosylhydrolase [Oscillospiraceae bacterium]|nr:family 10 glycosylhydrolase [Oscillospiraceae bacterium]